MALNIKIDLKNCYDFEKVSEDYSLSKFNSSLSNGTNASMGILISQKTHILLPDVYNLAFGPMNSKGKLNDSVKLAHSDHSKVFSTIVFAAIMFLTNHTDKYLGIDGSSNARAYLYFRIIQNNYDTLTEYFDIFGVNYYVRILRANDSDHHHAIDPSDLEAVPKEIIKGEMPSHEKLHNYFIFKLKQEIIDGTIKLELLNLHDI